MTNIVSNSIVVVDQEVSTNGTIDTFVVTASGGIQISFLLTSIVVALAALIVLFLWLKKSK